MGTFIKWHVKTISDNTGQLFNEQFELMMGINV